MSEAVGAVARKRNLRYRKSKMHILQVRAGVVAPQAKVSGQAARRCTYAVLRGLKNKVGSGLYALPDVQ